MPCLVRDSIVWPPLPSIGTLVSHNRRLTECGVVRTEEPISATMNVYLIHMSK